MAASSSAPKRIFVAEDDRAILDLVRTRLLVAGYEVDFARTGTEALKRIGSKTPDAIILDVNMPELDGFAVLHALKSRTQTASVPVMMLTARNAAEDVSKALNLGAADYLTKPFKDELLLLRTARLVRPMPTGSRQSATVYL